MATPVPDSDLPDTLKVPASDLPDHLAQTKKTDDLPWDVPVTSAQMRATQEKTKQADETVKAIESTAPEPGLAHLIWSIVGSPLEIAVRGGQSALGERPLPTGTEGLEEAGLGVTPRAIGEGFKAADQGVANAAARSSSRESARQPWTSEQVTAAARALGAPASVEATTKKATRAVEKRLNESPSAAQAALDKINAAREAGDPLILPDVHGGAEKLAGRVYRAGGEGGENLAQTLIDRNASAVDRLTGNINRDVGADSAYQMFDDLRAARSAAAKPLFEKAKAGGSIAPLETQLQSSFSDASAAEAEATKALQDARNQLTVAAGKQTQTGGNVYSTSAANEGTREAEAAVTKATNDLTLARKQKQDSLTLLQQAQEDRTLGKPGAVWNPRIQEFLEDPDIQSGIKRGWQIERNEALAEGRPLNATEYAITGFEQDGSPIVSKVPTFKLLQVAKEGLDAMLEGEQYRDKLTGELNKYGVSVEKKLRAYVKELDKTNPDYEPARQQWSGDTANMRALKVGQTALRNKPEINQRLAADMSESERESAKLGLAQTLREAAADKGPLGSEFRTIAGTEYGAKGNRERIAPFFNNEADLDRFVKSVEREATKARTKQKIMGGSQTAEREGEDERTITPGDAAHAALALGRGSLPSLLHTGMNWGQKLWDRRDPALNAQIARILGSAGITLERDQQGRVTIRPSGTPPP